VHDEDGERVVPKPEMPEHKAPWIGPHDIMVPSLEYVGEDHIRGWNVGPEIFGDGLPHDEDKEDKSYIFDKDVDQRITYMGDPMNVNGEQLPGVMVPWDRIPHPVEAARSGPPTPRPTHFVMHNDGTISMETVPADSSVPYRSGLRSVVFKPCKKHPLHGCELDPPMPQPSAAPAPLPTIGFGERSLLEGESTTGTAAAHAPEYIVDQEGRRFVKRLFDEAADLDEKPGPITAKEVRELESKYAAYLDVKPYNQLYLNVFDYIEQEYEVTSGADLELKRILRDHHYHGKSMNDYIDPSEDTAGEAMAAEGNGVVAVDEPMVDIAYGGGTQEAMSQERVMCKPMDFACFFGVSGWG